MRVLFPLFASLALAGCPYDPHAHRYTTTEPKTADIAGTYVLDELYLPSEVGESRPDIRVSLHADGTFAATNVPPSRMDTPDAKFFTSLVSGTGKWEKDTTGTLDPGNKRIWGVKLRTPDNRFSSANLTGDKPPYGLIFTLGDPDSGDAVILKKQP